MARELAVQDAKCSRDALHSKCYYQIKPASRTLQAFYPGFDREKLNLGINRDPQLTSELASLFLYVSISLKLKVLNKSILAWKQKNNSISLVSWLGLLNRNETVVCFVLGANSPQTIFTSNGSRTGKVTDKCFSNSSMEQHHLSKLLKCWPQNTVS